MLQFPSPATAVERSTSVSGLVIALSGLTISGVAASAQDAVTVHLDVAYLAAPTDWCPADAGVPMSVTMDGPDIIRGPEDFPRKVKVRRGSELTIVDGENINSFSRAEDFVDQYTKVVGRFSAEVRSCISVFGENLANGTWTLKGPDGEIVDTGLIEDQYLPFSARAPFFRPVSGRTPAYYAKFGDRLLFTAVYPKAETKQTFLAKPDKE